MAPLLGRLRPGVDVLTLANLDAGAVAQAPLDLAALRRLFEASPASRAARSPASTRRVCVASSPTPAAGEGPQARRAAYSAAAGKGTTPGA